MACGHFRRPSLISRLLARPAAPILRALLGPGLNPRPRRTRGIGRGWKRAAGLDPRPLEISAATRARRPKAPVVSMTYSEASRSGALRALSGRERTWNGYRTGR